MARPSNFKQETVDEICARLATGEPLAVICRDDHMPYWRTVYLWMHKYPQVNTDIACAREVGHDAIAEECLQIANTPMVGEKTEETDKGVKIIRDDMLGHRKLQVETRLKLLAKWNPKKYGDRQAVELTGANGGPVEITDTERAAKIEAIMATAQARAHASGQDLV
jgi:hypothetical protein